jgi:hypothetical protein
MLYKYFYYKKENKLNIHILSKILYNFAALKYSAISQTERRTESYRFPYSILYFKRLYFVFINDCFISGYLIIKSVGNLLF